MMDAFAVYPSASRKAWSAAHLGVRSPRLVAAAPPATLKPMTSDDDSLNAHDHFSTDDVALAAALALVSPVVASDRLGPFAQRFVFRRDRGLDELVAQYWRGELRVEPQAYLQQVRSLEAQYFGDIE